ncbi:glycosyltransferase, MGT family [Sanguibacter gelidistatuariae]|uniref:Glycosyltransferase, MGT family n=1 Tax=Sanguibacter gelidistatuariae TaxID=1814289 RepID=A0A1G6XJE6_9MICO|nr:glycosyltransferase [Sanguibacter gelidistatuariae]SDD78191.1 glycosyltransferase, MGT family [Sanguibacter gelidistatuariae]
MSRILFVTWDGGGNVTPAVEIGRELQRRGDDIRFLGQHQQRESLELAGFGFAAYRTPGPWTATGRRGSIATKVGFLRLLVGRSLGRDLVAEVGRHPADLVVIDCLLYGALDAASRGGIRHVVFVHSLFAAVAEKMAGGAPGAVAQIVGLNPWKLWSKAVAVVAVTLEELDRPTEKPLAISYTGPVLPTIEGEPGNRRTSSATILVSLSTTYIAGQTAVMQNILDAVADLPVRVLLTTGPAVDPDDLHPPANAEVRRFVPHAQVMPGVSLVVGHGGHSTTMLALAHDLPLVVLPMNPAFDQPLIGQRIHDLGAGATLPSSSTPAQVRAVIDDVLADESCRHEAARLGAAIRAARGRETAADLLQSLIT